LPGPADKHFVQARQAGWGNNVSEGHRQINMFAIIGVVLVIGAVIGGYLMEHGQLGVLVQPAELLIIGGAAIGTLLIANPLPILIKIVHGLLGVLKGSPYTKANYLETLKMLNDLFMVARKNGMAKLEEDVEAPEKSQVFTKYPNFLKNHHAVHFVCDTLRMAISGGVQPFDLDQMMEMDMEVHHHEASVPVSALTTVADALPGLGIVAAVLGVVITMGALGGPPEEIGHKVAAALVGTFLGILLCYGFLGPLASNITKMNDAEGEYLQCLRQGVMAFVKGAAPALAIEFARRSIPGELRPSFFDTEAACKGGAAAGAPAEQKVA
jgi:chemotaxis protein MotA